MKEPPRQSDINLLEPGFKKKFDLWRTEVLKRYPNARVFESKRPQERQERLYSQWRTRPGKIITNIKHIGMHWLGKAVDVVFLNDKNQPTRSWPYDDLIALAKKYNIKNLKPFETCHFEDNGKPLSLPQTIMLVFETIYKEKFWTIPSENKITAQVDKRYAMIKDKTPSEQIQELCRLIGIKVEEINQKIVKN